MSYTPLVDPIFTGNPRVPTASFPDNDTTAASTGFVSTNFTTLTTSQTISGAKTFSSDVTFAASTDLLMDNTSVITLGDITISRAGADILTLASGDMLRVSTAPTNDNDLTNKAYVDSVATGLDVKESVRVATAAALPAYSRTGNVITASANGALAAVDGVTLVAADRLLLKDGAAGADNGIYVVTTVGDGSNPYVLTRSSDADNSPAGEVTGGMFTFVEEGTANADKGFVLTTNDPITLNTTALAFTQFSSNTAVSVLDDLTDVDTTGVVDGAILRYDSTGTQWNDTSTLLFTDAGQLQVTTVGSAGGLLLGGDVNLYRSSANVLRTDDELQVGAAAFINGSNGITLSGSTTDLAFTALAADTNTAISAQVTGDTQNRVIMQADGKLLWGSGGAAQDTNLYRSAVDLLKTDDSFEIGVSGGKTSLRLTSTGTDVGLTIGTDTNLYRSAADTLKTDDSLQVGTTFTALGKAVLSGGQRVAYGSVKTANYTAILASDYVIPVNSSGGGFTISLPSGHSAGDTFVVKDVNGSAETNNVIIDPNGAETIEGASTFAMTINYQSATVVSNGTNWFVI